MPSPSITSDASTSTMKLATSVSPVTSNPFTTSSAADDNILMAIPKKGRLFDRVNKLLEGSGIDYRRPDRVDIALCTNLPITLVFLPASDIATYIGEGNIDLGITGQDILLETRLECPDIEINEILELGFGKCKLCLLGPVKSNIKDPRSLSGGRIVTSFPELTKDYFRKIDAETGKKTTIRTVSGSVEAACGLGLADAVVDLVETGTTMKAAGLEKIADVVTTEAVLISNKHSKNPEAIALIKQRFEGYLTATQYMMISYNVHRDELQKALSVTPGKRSPSIMALEQDGWVAVQALVRRKEANNLMDELKKIGASDILLFTISNSRM